MDHITDKCCSAHTCLLKLIYYLFWQTFLLFEARIVTNKKITIVECEGNGKVLKTDVYCIEMLNYHGPQFQKHWNGNEQLFCTWWKGFTLQLCMIGGFFFQVRAVLAVKMRTPRMIQIHGTMHIGASTALLQVSYWHYGILIC